MTFRRSLRYRVAVALALFGGAASLLLAVMLFLLFHQIERRFVDDAIDSEIEQFFALRETQRDFPLPRTSLLRVYEAQRDAAGAPLPPSLRGLGPGRYEQTIDDEHYRVAVVDRAGGRFYFLYDQSGFERREWRIKIALAASVLAMMLVSAAGGVWMANRVIAPVRELGRRVRSLDPSGAPPPLAGNFAADEVGELAGTIEGYLKRLHGFIERERNFTAEASHELRTPLSVILGASEVLLAGGELSGRGRLRVERIARAAKDMGFIMEGLLTLAREPESGGDVGPCEVADVVREVVERYRPLASSRPVEIGMEGDARTQVAADRTLLGVAVDNLVRNALMYTVEGRVTVRVKEGRVIVEDTGPGFAGERSAPARERPPKARTGIGLPLVRRICERYGWRLSAQDRPGGARVEIVFASADDAPERPRRADPPFV